MKSICLFSGGIDSTVLLYHMREEGEVLALSVHYGQRHICELEAASRIATRLGILHRIVDLRLFASWAMTGSSQTSPEIAVPEGHFTDPRMTATVIPNRNMILLALAGAWAVQQKADCIAFAPHADDLTNYPDCRPQFVEAMNLALNLASNGEVNLRTPFVRWSKSDIVMRGAFLQAPLEDSYSCYNGRRLHCGRCSACVERHLAFRDAGLKDPTGYEDHAYADSLTVSVIGHAVGRISSTKSNLPVD